MPFVTDPPRLLTALISARGAADVNSPSFELSRMQASLRKDIRQVAILEQFQSYTGLALLSSQSGVTDKFLTLHHFVVSRSAAAGGKPSPPVVYCCEGTEELKLVEPVSHMSGTGPRWPILKKAWTPIQIPPLSTILQLNKDDIIDGDLASLKGTETFTPAYFMAVNGRALEAIEAQADPDTFTSLLLGLLKIARDDLRTSYLESHPTADPSVEDTVTFATEKGRGIPLGAQIQSAFTWA